MYHFAKLFQQNMKTNSNFYSTKGKNAYIKSLKCKPSTSPKLQKHNSYSRPSSHNREELEQ